eukprot:2389992-Alexandrium_andersonii.AAC.1
MDVFVMHAMQFEASQLEQKHMAAVALDWSKFFDTIDREVGIELLASLMPEGGVAEGYLRAEEA